jgi:ubiquitin thioesterase protein OTUB1
MENDNTIPMATAAACEAQLEDIRSEVRKDPLLTPPLPLNESALLLQEVAGDAVYTVQARSLFGGSDMSTKSYNFTKIRYSRRDGNCFYRCAGFRLCELVVQHPEMAPAFVAKMKVLEPQLTAFFGDFVSDFTEVLMEIFEGVVGGRITTSAEVYEKYTSDDGAYLIVALRYIVSAYLQAHEDDYAPFVEGLGYATVKDYCNTEVEAVDHESDNVQLAAFAQVLDVCLLVYGLDRNAGTNVTEYAFNDENNEGGTRLTIELLYMPGHYNLLER